MIPIPQSRLSEVLTPIGESRRVESNAERLADVAYCISQIEEGYELRSVAAYVDNLDDPKSCLIVRVGKAWTHPAPVCGVMLLWVRPDHRSTSPELVADLFKTLDAFAALNACESISGSSWVYLGSQDMDALWCRYGYDLQEKIFIKPLT